jgi:outer membrane receptor protein involved in Fe transport
LEGVPTRYIQVAGTNLWGTKVNTTVPVDGDEQFSARLAATYKRLQFDAAATQSERHSPLSRFSHALLVERPQQRERQRRWARGLWQGSVGPVNVHAAAYLSHQERRDHIPLYPKGAPFPYGGSTMVYGQTYTTGALVRLEIPLLAEHRLILSAFGDVTRVEARADAVDPVDGNHVRGLVRQNTLTATLTQAAEYQWDPGWGFHLNAGLVLEGRSSYGVSLAPRASLTWNLLPFWTSRMAYSEGTRTPDRYDFTTLAQGVVAGRVTGTRNNPSLRPERVRSLDAGVSFDPHAMMHLSLDGYLSRHEDSVFNSVEGLALVPRNQPARTVAGFELNGHVEVVPRWVRAWGGAGFSKTIHGATQKQDVAVAVFGAEVTPREGWELGVRNRIRWRDGRDAAGGPSHMTDVFMSMHPLGDRMMLSMGIRNVFNQNARSHEEAALPGAADVSVPSPTRTLFLAVEGRL